MRSKKTLTRFIEIYCKQNHHTEKLCKECADIHDYAEKRLELCPYDPKPKCKDCKTHCYSPIYRDKIRKVMKFSGMYMVKRGRIDLLFGYFMH